LTSIFDNRFSPTSERDIHRGFFVPPSFQLTEINRFWGRKGGNLPSSEKPTSG